ncbi:putative ABC transport system permease protein [Desulfacinum infernum DSM 9756]|uniref:Putative ABC transport system permease protein n=1 Tax=Desulfacinum infernum DSM 9756 TaxID=1121391 RepID=A0A1M5IDU8_9BACT|nr:FtsX-like permease family protein [Desulfacinum infernum]SHG26259.1 putative ABC transport system permease protein [Desulfacinum infernum DSM 9756]
MTFWRFVPLAFRNIRRNRVRSSITLAAIAVGATALLLAGGFFQDTFLRMREGIIHSHLGHVQIFKKGYSQYGAAHPFDYLIQNPAALVSRIENLPNVELVTQRILFSALLSTGENTVAVTAQAIQPGREAQLTVIRNLRHADTGLAILHGENLSEESSFEILLGQGLARSIDAKVGDELVILTNTIGGSLNAFDVTVKGIFASPSKEFDDHGIRIPLETASKLLRTDAVQSLVVLLTETDLTETVRASIEQLASSENWEVEVLAWPELADFYNRVVALYQRQFAVLALIIALIVVLSIFNTMNMAISERTREIGTIMAIGYRRRDVLSIFLLEGLFLGLLGGLLGLVFGQGLGFVLSVSGIPMPPPPGGSVEWKAGIEITRQLLLQAFGMCVLASTLSSIYPAWRASRLVIADALRHT